MSIKKLSLILLIISLIIQSLLFVFTRIALTKQIEIISNDNKIDSLTASLNIIEKNILLTNFYSNHFSANLSDSLNIEICKDRFIISNSEIESQFININNILKAVNPSLLSHNKDLKYFLIEFETYIKSLKTHNELFNSEFYKLDYNASLELSQKIDSFTRISDILIRRNIKELAVKSSYYFDISGILTFIQFLILIVYLSVIYRSIYKSFQYLMESANQIINGNLDLSPPKVIYNNEMGVLLKIFNKMILHLQENQETINVRRWIRIGENNLYETVTNKSTISNYTNSVLSQLCHYISASCGAFYTYEPIDKYLHLSASYALIDANLRKSVKLEETILGEAVLNKDISIINNIPEGYIKIESSLGNTMPKNLLIIPIYYDEQLLAAIEIAKYNEISDIEKEYLTIAQKIIANTFLSNWNKEIKESWNI